MAWLEEDPELAARYVELASSGNEVYPAELCMLLAMRTGRKELAAHYTWLFEESRKNLPKDSMWWKLKVDELEAAP